ncbi:MAG: ABC transporter permease [Verrucomicrobiota bacterium]
MSRNWKRLAADYGPMLAIWVVLVLLFGALSDNFLTTRTLANIAGQVPALAVIACGMTFVLIIAGIDLSVGSVLALSGSVLCVSMGVLPLPVAILLAILTGGLAGLFNGAVSVFLKIPSFIVSLGTLKIAFGLAMLVTSSETVTVGLKLEPFVDRFLGVPVSFWVALGVVLGGQFILTRTVFGRYLIAIGTNDEAVRLAGVPTASKKIAVFVFCGLLTGLASVLFAARLGGMNADAGNGLELAAIAAVVIGGTSLMGGRGSVVNSFVGVLIILTLDAGLAQIGAREFLKHLITGVVIIVAVTLDALRGDLLASLQRRFQPKTSSSQ